MSPTFNSMRLEFGTIFSKIQDTIKEMSITLENLKLFLRDYYLTLVLSLLIPVNDQLISLADIIISK